MSRIAYYAGFKEGESSAAAPQAALTDERIKELIDAIDFKRMVTADDLFYLIARAIESEVRAQVTTEGMREAALTTEVRAALNACINCAQISGWEPANVARQWLDSNPVKHANS